MFSNTMEVDCSLDEFARVLAAGGYISEDSCFVDADIPSMLCAFDASDVLDSTESFLANPYGNSDLSRALGMTQIPNQSLLESCLPDSFVHSKTSQDAPRVQGCRHSCKSGDSGLVNVVLNDSLQNVTTTLPSKESNCSKEFYLDNNFINNTLSLNFNAITAKEKEFLSTSEFQVNSGLPHSCTSTSENTDYRQNFPSEDIEYHQDFPSESIDRHPDFHYQNGQNYGVFFSASMQPQASSCPDRTSEHSTDNLLCQSLSSKPKQKRKRRSKGYSKPAKARKKKSKVNPSVDIAPKAKKQKTAQNRNQQETQNEQIMNTFCGSVDVPQEDSGFESGEKNAPETPDSVANVTVEKLETVVQSEQPRTLRRSSRATRNIENYNFRLTSLVKRVETERRQQEPRQPKDKIKPPPLSKYRRRTANARERDRMKEINDAFDKLQSSLPSIQRVDGKQKITKFTILKHALNYIASLRDILGFEPAPASQDDDIGSESFSLRPASVTSSGGEDSCSSTGSAHSMSSPPINKGISASLTLEGDRVYDQHLIMETPSEQNLPLPKL